MENRENNEGEEEEKEVQEEVKIKCKRMSGVVEEERKQPKTYIY